MALVDVPYYCPKCTHRFNTPAAAKRQFQRSHQGKEVLMTGTHLKYELSPDDAIRIRPLVAFYPGGPVPGAAAPGGLKRRFQAEYDGTGQVPFC